jgi:hypothetical protein
VAVDNPVSSTAAVRHQKADPPAVMLANEGLVMAYDPPLLMADREETSMIAEQHDDVDGARRETRTETVAHDFKPDRTNSVDKGGDQDGDHQEQSIEVKRGSTEEVIPSGACTAQPINKIAMVAFGFSAW